jgi:hypothetical protein
MTEPGESTYVLLPERPVNNISGETVKKLGAGIEPGIEPSIAIPREPVNEEEFALAPAVKDQLMR